MIVPEWLANRGGILKPGVRENMYFVMLGSMEYKVETRPASGRYICAVQQSVNGRRLDDPALTYPTADAALAGGLEQLRAVLGW